MGPHGARAAAQIPAAGFQRRGFQRLSMSTVAEQQRCCVRIALLLLATSFANLCQAQSVDGGFVGFNVTEFCRLPQPCSQYLGDTSPCTNLLYTQVYDTSLGVDICAAISIANAGDILYIPSTGYSTARCIDEWKGDGRCDPPNNHNNEECDYDGGDCCLSTCERHCANEPDLYSRNSINCEYVCGERGGYKCLDEMSRYSTVTAWCGFGTIQSPAECYYTKLEVAKTLQECALSMASHGNKINSAIQCGNRSETCTAADLAAQNGCHLTPSECWDKGCCQTALASKFIEEWPTKLPTIAELYDMCATTLTDGSEDCFKYMVKCVQDNRLRKGGCCACDAGWSGWQCKTPLCWPKCKHGHCVAPDVCYCSEGWKGDDCAHPICTPECVPSQGLCVLPNQCECFYGWQGIDCGQPLSIPDCVNGEPFGPDLCKCEYGWGGRLCDYPLCQTWPEPTADCGQGTCVKPYTCVCEPGWELNRPINSSGYDILPFWSPGRDVTLETSDSYVKADSRINFLSYWDRFYNASNAFLCEKFDCAQTFDPRCTNCTKSGCTKCEPTFFANMETGRCERCSDVFPHCQICGPVYEDLSNVRCLWCDPMYVLYYDKCISDGPIEFGSPVYHVFKDQNHVILKLHRSFYALDPDFARPIEVLVRTRDGTAHSRSLPYGEWLAGFEFNIYRVTFAVNTTNESVVLTDMERYETQKEVKIKIYNDGSYHTGLRYFDVELFLPPEHIAGHQGPLTPFLNPQDYEPSLPWLAPLNFGRSPQYERDDVLATTRVYIWDREEATIENTTVSGDGVDWWIRTTINQKRYVNITGIMYNGSLSTAPTDRFLIIYRPTADGHQNSLGTPSWVNRDSANLSVHYGSYRPTVVGSYKLIIEKTVPGIFGQYWWNRYVHREFPILPDTTRIDHSLNFHWDDIGAAPSFVRWQFHVHMSCLRVDRWQTAFGLGIGIVASPGSTVRVWFLNDGVIERYIPLDAVMPSVHDLPDIFGMDYDACLDKSRENENPPYIPVIAMICLDFIYRIPELDHVGGIRTFTVEVEPRRPILEKVPVGIFATGTEPQRAGNGTHTTEKTPVDVYAVMYHQDEGATFGWHLVKQGCLLTHGLHVAGSPFDGFYAKYGDASTEHSTLTTLLDTEGPIETVINVLTQAKITLRDADDQKIPGGPELSDALIITLRKDASDGSEVDQQLSAFWISPGVYMINFRPRTPTDGKEDLGKGTFTRWLHAVIDQDHIKYSPMEVIVNMGISDPNRTVLIGNYTPVKVSETKEFMLKSYKYNGEPQIFGGDKYTVRFEGPVHDPRPTELEYTGTVEDNLNGTYNVTFEIMRAGEYYMHIMLYDEHIRDSPFFPVVVYADLSAEYTFASGPGVDPADGIDGIPARVYAGIETYFEITVKDYYNVQYYEGGAQFNITIPALSPALEDFIHITDHDNGKYTVRYKVCPSGISHVNVEIKTYGAFYPIFGSPFRINVIPLDASAPHSPVHIVTATYSGFPARAEAQLRDHCYNIPRNTRNQSSLEASIERIGPDPDPEGLNMTVETDILRSSPGLASIFFTPERRGQYELVFLVQGLPANRTPLAFEVTPAGMLPDVLGAVWSPGSVGGSWKSTFYVTVPPHPETTYESSWMEEVKVEGSSAPFAGERAIYHITSRDLWGDPLAIGNDTFLIGLWREVGPCPPAMRCDVFSQSLESCNQMPLCYFDSRDSICRPSCPTSPRFGKYALTDPDSTITQGRIAGSSYDLAVSTDVAGTYHATVTALRPGGLQAFYWDSPVRARRFQAEVVQAPLDFNWGVGKPAAHVPGPHFVVRWIGWLRIKVQDNYTFYVESDGGYEVYLNGTLRLEVASERSVEARNAQSVYSFDVMLRAGFTPLQIDYTHSMRQRYLGSHFRLSYRSPATPFQVVPASAIYYEEALSRQKGHPVKHIVRPFPRAAALSIEGESELSSSNRTVVAGVDFVVRVHSVDMYGNILTSRDPTAKVSLTAEPLLTGAEWQGYVLAADRWRAVPLANGSWDVLIRPDAGTGIWNLTFHLTTLEAGGTVFLKRMRVNVIPNGVHPLLSWVVCMPLSPQPAGTLVTCTVVPRDLERNDVPGLEIEMQASRPDSAHNKWTEKLPVLHNVSRTFFFRPEVAGEWNISTTIIFDRGVSVNLAQKVYKVVPALVSTLALGSQVNLPSALYASEWNAIGIIARDAYGNIVNASGEDWSLQLRGGTNNAIIRKAMSSYVSNGEYASMLAPISERTSYEMRAEHVSRRLNTSLGQCVDLQPYWGRIKRLSRHQAVGSIALLECLPGYEWVSGSTSVRCEARDKDGRDVANYGADWRDLYSQPASMLVCRPATHWCPLPSFVNAELYGWDWRREVGSLAIIRCLQGYSYVAGDIKIVCGTRDGAGVWLTPSGNPAIQVVCASTQYFCPALNASHNSVISNVSADRDIGSVVEFSCEPGYEYMEGNDIVSCTAESIWKRPLQVIPYVSPKSIKCRMIEHFCEDAVKFVSVGVGIAGPYERKLGSKVVFLCLDGFNYLHGDAEAICKVSRDNDQVGHWVNSDPDYFGLVAFQPLKCAPTQGYCPIVKATHGFLVSLSDELYHGSVAVFECDAGYEQIGGSKQLVCEHESDGIVGNWRDQDGNDKPLVCNKTLNFCPVPVPSSQAVQLSISDGLRLDSVIEMDCKPGYEESTPKELHPRLQCRPAAGNVGQWVAKDGKASSPDILRCRGIINWCPLLTMRNGSTTSVVGHRTPYSTANLACNMGYRLQYNSHPIPNNTRLDCHPGTWQSGGKWKTQPVLLNGAMMMLPFEDLWCNLTAHFCPDLLPGYTSTLFGEYYQLGYYERKYYWVFHGNNEIGSTARIDCNVTAEFSYSYGHRDLVCGYNADGTGGAWRSLHGMLAVPLHCYFNGVPDEVKDSVYRDDDCFLAQTANVSIPWYFERTGSIVFWIQPMTWQDGGTILSSSYPGGDIWVMQYVSPPGTLRFKVKDLVGDVMFDTTQNGRKQLGDWFHITLVWELGIGLAGLGEVRLYVDGILAPPSNPYQGLAVPPDGTTGSHRIDHFTWIDNQPDDKLVIGSWWGNGIDGTYTKVRVFSRTIPFRHSELLRKSEDPRCGFDEACFRVSFERAYIEEIYNPLDPRFGLVPLRPETRWRLRCYPGYSKTDGDEEIECKIGGAWGVPGKTRAAKLLRCCNLTENFCPTFDISTSPGLVMDTSIGKSHATCQDLTLGGRGINFLSCPEIVVPGGSVTYSDFRVFGSEATLTCNPGYESKSALEMASFVTCYRGEYDAAIHLNAEVPGVWKTTDLRPANLLECWGTQNWCPLITASHAIVEYGVEFRRHGADVTVECIPGYSGGPLFNSMRSVTFKCQLDQTWKNSAGKSLTQFECLAVAGACPSQLASELGSTWAYTGFQGKMQKSMDSYELLPTQERRVGKDVLADCSGNYSYSFGDRALVCDLAPHLADPRLPTLTEVLYNPSKIWRSESPSARHEGGRPAIALRCRDSSPQVEGVLWHTVDCLGGEEDARRVKPRLSSEGTISMWVFLPDSSDYVVIWSSLNDSCAPTDLLLPEVTTTPTSTTSTSTTASIYSNFSNISSNESAMSASDYWLENYTTNLTRHTMTTVTTTNTTTKTSTTNRTSTSNSTSTTVTSSTTTTTNTTTTSTESGTTSTSTNATRTTTTTNTSTTSTTNATIAYNTNATSTTTNTTSTTKTTTTTITTTTRNLTISQAENNISNISNNTIFGEGSSAIDLPDLNASNLTNESVAGPEGQWTSPDDSANATNGSNVTDFGLRTFTTATTTNTTTSTTTTSTNATSTSSTTNTSTTTNTTASTTTTTTSTSTSTNTTTSTNTSSTSATTSTSTSSNTSSTTSTSTKYTTTTTNATTSSSTTNTTTITTTNSTTTTTSSNFTLNATNTTTRPAAAVSPKTTTSMGPNMSKNASEVMKTLPGQCHGPQHMILDKGSLQVQIGIGFGAYSIPVLNTSLAGKWAHLLYSWSTSIGDTSLYINGQLVDNSKGYGQNISQLPLDFPLWLGNPPSKYPQDNPPENTWCEFASVFDKPFTEKDVETLRYYEVPQRPYGKCAGGNVITCPEMPRGGHGLKLAHVVNLTSSDPWVPPDPKRPGVRARFACDAGYTRSGGNYIIECTADGKWTWFTPTTVTSTTSHTTIAQQFNNTTIAANLSLQGLGDKSDEHDNVDLPFDFGNMSANDTWLECCDFIEDFCPPFDPGLVEIESFGRSVACGDLSEEQLSSKTRVFSHLGAVMRFTCPTGYTHVGGPKEIHCAIGYHVGGVSGRWIDFSGLIAEKPACEHLDNWCPVIAGLLSYVVKASAARSLGSILEFACIDGHIPDSGDAILECSSLLDGSGGQWLSNGTIGVPLRCKVALVTGVGGGGGVVTAPTQSITLPPGTLDRRYLSNASYSCKPAYIQTHGDNDIYCVLGASPFSSDGTMGRWADKNHKYADNAEVVLCVLQPDWCPIVDIVGKNSLVSNLTDGYRLGSDATIRCFVGYEPMSGHSKLTCVNNGPLTAGEWNLEPFTCKLARDFCPPPRPVNGFVVESVLEYKLGDNLTFQCNIGFQTLFGDFAVTCHVSDYVPDRGQWKTADGTAAVPIVCVPVGDYCQVPNVTNGYISSISQRGRIGGEIHFKCREGFQDTRGPIDRRTALCLHNVSGNGSGAYYVGMSYASRDLLRAISMVRLLLQMLEHHSMLPPVLEVDPIGIQISFAERWRRALRNDLRSLKVQTHVQAVFQQFDEVTSDYSWWKGDYIALAYFTIDHVRILHRLLVTRAEMQFDISSEEARAIFNTYDRIHINFQDGNTPTVDGWLRDSGDAFGDRGNGFSYGWACSVNESTLNNGAFNRGKHIYTTLENTLVATDTRSECRGQEWRIRLPTGVYRVEVTVQDTQYTTLASGCALQGENLGFPDMVQPPGSRETRNLTVDVVDFLTLSADRDQRCSSINRITIQNTANANATNPFVELLSCERIEKWCTPPTIPHQAHVSNNINIHLTHPVNTEVHFECNDGYVYQHGSQMLVCSSDVEGLMGEWRLPSGGQAKTMLSCIKNRTWCPELELENGTVLMKVEPPSYEIGARATLSCRAGLQPTAGHSELKCILGTSGVRGEWRAQSKKDTWDIEVVPLSCDFVATYCPPLSSSSADFTVAPGFLGADEPWPYETIVVNETMQVEAAQLGKQVSMACPQHFQRVRGDTNVVCEHGANGKGVWQVLGADTTTLVDAALAEPLVCELETVYGVTRHYFTTSIKPQGGAGSSGYDVVPNIDQYSSAFDAAYFRTYLIAPQTDKYNFVVEVVGRFLLTINEKVLLTGRSQGSAPKRFKSGDVMLTKSEVNEVLLQYVLDPLMTSVGDVAPMPRHVRLLWVSSTFPLEVVPPTVLRHSMAPINGYPMIVKLESDPNPCSSDSVVTLHNLPIGYKGYLTHGSPDRSYNPNLNCRWHFTFDSAKRVNFNVVFFDVQPTPSCVADSLTYRSTLGGAIDDIFCGKETGMLASKKSKSFAVYFNSDSDFESKGFNISYEVLPESAPDPFAPVVR